MKKYAVAAVSDYQSGAEIETDYYGSQRIEVRTGIIHALTKKIGCKLGRKWYLGFLLKVCKECALESEKLLNLERKTPYPTGEGEPYRRALDKRHGWSFKASDLGKIEVMCAIGLMDAFANEYNHPSDLRKLITAIGDELLLLMANQGVAPSKHESTKKFLEAYKQRCWGKRLPDEWFQAVVRYEEFGLFYFSNRDEQVLANPSIRKHLVAHLKAITEREGFTEFSTFGIGYHQNKSVDGRSVAQYLAQFMLKTGELDSLVSFADVQKGKE
jgi:hypothetical protein